MKVQYCLRLPHIFLHHFLISSNANQQNTYKTNHNQKQNERKQQKLENERRIRRGEQQTKNSTTK